MAPSHFRENSSLVIEKKCSNDEIKDNPSVAQMLPKCLVSSSSYSKKV